MALRENLVAMFFLVFLFLIIKSKNFGKKHDIKILEMQSLHFRTSLFEKLVDRLLESRDKVNSTIEYGVHLKLCVYSLAGTAS